MLEDILKKYGGVEVSAMEVYSDIFHLGENEIQKHDEEKGAYKSNPLWYWKNDRDSKALFLKAKQQKKSHLKNIQSRAR